MLGAVLELSVNGEDWSPFFPDTFFMPPFPSYFRHSTISAGCAEALKLWTGSEEFGQSVEGRWFYDRTESFGQKKVTLMFLTFTETANMVECQELWVVITFNRIIFKD
jgi:hypothetical protein